MVSSWLGCAGPRPTARSGKKVGEDVGIALLLGEQLRVDAAELFAAYAVALLANQLSSVLEGGAAGVLQYTYGKRAVVPKRRAAALPAQTCAVDIEETVVTECSDRSFSSGVVFPNRPLRSGGMPTKSTS